MAVCTLLLSGACTRQKSSLFPANLIVAVDKMEAMPDSVLKNGAIVTGCHLEVKDTSICFDIKIPDNRFENLSEDSMKTIVRKDFSDPNKKLNDNLKKHNINLQYIFTFQDGSVKRVKYSPSELDNL